MRQWGHELRVRQQSVEEVGVRISSGGAQPGLPGLRRPGLSGAAAAARVAFVLRLRGRLALSRRGSGRYRIRTDDLLVVNQLL
jgi:hypothetical protein